MKHKSKRTNSGKLGKRRAKKYLAPRTAEQFFEMHERFQDAWNDVTHVIARMRADNVSLAKASREFGLNPRTVLRLGGSALRKRPNGRYSATTSDRLLRVMRIPSEGEARDIAVRDSRHATRLAKYWNALQSYLETGDARALLKFEGKYVIDTRGERFPLPTNLDDLNRTASAGKAFSFETIYARSA